MVTLGIDTSNYATSIAVVDNLHHRVLVHKKQFLPVEQGKLGLRQQDALFHHIKNLTDMLETLKEEYGFNQLEAIGVSTKPTSEENSYMPCFLAGKLTAQAFSTALKIPLLETSHQIGHLQSVLFDINCEGLYEKEILMLHVSGGTTDILLAKNGQVVKTLGSSKDLFAGQAVDRLGVKLGFPFPAGEYVSKLALACDETFSPKISVKGCDCNLSGLENQCDKLLKDGFSKEYVAKYTLSFIAHSLLKMIENAQKEHSGLPLVLAGGVMSSQVIKEIITKKLPYAQFAQPMFSQDNAIGAAAYAYRRMING